MRNIKVFRVVLGICLVQSLLCILLWYFLQPFTASFPELLLGQLSLSSETKPLMPSKYLSAEFVLGQVDLSDILHAEYIDLQKDVFFWDPHYVGFPRTELSVEEIRQLQQLLSAGNLFYPSSEGDDYQCVDKTGGGDPRLESCPQGGRFMEQYSSINWEADQSESVGVLQFFLSNGRLAEIRVYQTPSGLAFEPYEKTGDWWLMGITSPSPLLDSLTGRASVHPVEILWPWMSSSKANDRAARVIGDRYWKAFEFVEKSSAIIRAFGDIQDIRPAVGLNNYSSWMDSTSIFLTFRVIGTRGEGAVIVQGYDCLDLRMVFDGKPLEDGEYYVCP